MLGLFAVVIYLMIGYHSGDFIFKYVDRGGRSRLLLLFLPIGSLYLNDKEDRIGLIRIQVIFWPIFTAVSLCLGGSKDLFKGYLSLIEKTKNSIGLGEKKKMLEAHQADPISKYIEIAEDIKNKENELKNLHTELAIIKETDKEVAEFEKELFALTGDTYQQIAKIKLLPNPKPF
jgi:hypothetical protein